MICSSPIRSREGIHIRSTPCNTSTSSKIAKFRGLQIYLVRKKMSDAYRAAETVRDAAFVDERQPCSRERQGPLGGKANSRHPGLRWVCALVYSIYTRIEWKGDKRSKSRFLPAVSLWGFRRFLRGTTNLRKFHGEPRSETRQQTTAQRRGITNRRHAAVVVGSQCR